MADLTEVEYYAGSSLPDLWVTWRDAAEQLIPFLTEQHTFTLLVANRKDPTTAVFVKTDGFIGYDTDPNLRIGWTVGVDLDQLAPGLYDGAVLAVRDADGKPRTLPLTLRIKRLPGGALSSGQPDPPN